MLKLDADFSLSYAYAFDYLYNVRGYLFNIPPFQEVTTIDTNNNVTNKLKIINPFSKIWNPILHLFFDSRTIN